MGRRPHAQYGGWLRTVFHPAIRCRQYLLAGADSGSPRVGGGISPGVYLGPVHAVDQSSRYCSVLVPYVQTGIWVPNPPVLTWVNVWCSVNGRGEARGARFADEIPSETVDEWRREGWVDRFAGE